MNIDDFRKLAEQLPDYIEAARSIAYLTFDHGSTDDAMWWHRVDMDLVNLCADLETILYIPGR